MMGWRSDLSSDLMLLNLLNSKSLFSILKYVAAVDYEVVLKMKAMENMNYN
ncbi:MAG: hypothetical protein ACTS73_07500 [Arsenophonus sp. NEOnobi-MAG3]